MSEQFTLADDFRSQCNVNSSSY